ncbi:MAG TPA: S9 family peptidase [Myxococcota bacterium]
MRASHPTPMNRIAAIAIAALLGGSLGAFAEEPPDPLLVKTLFANPTFASPEISPDGQTLALIHNQGDLGIVISRAMAGGAATPLVKIDDPGIRLQWLGWANDSRLLLGGEARMEDAVGVRARRTQLYGVNRDGTGFRWLGKRWPRYGDSQTTVQVEDRIVHWTPDDPDTVLIHFESPYRDEWPRVMKVDVMSGALHPHAPPKQTVREWFVDGQAQVRAGAAYPAGERYELWARATANDEFEVVLRNDLGTDAATFAGFHADPTKLYVSKSHAGRAAIFEFDMRTKEVGALVFSHPAVDVDALLLSTDGKQRVIGFRYTTDSPQIAFIDVAAEREHRGLLRALSNEYGQAVQIEPVSASRNGEREILHVSSDTQPPTYFAYDRALKQLFPLFDERPGIRRDQLSPTKRVTYQARDGLAIPAFLTLPRGREAKRLPLIVIPHGGPWARDSIGWNDEVQLFASRGFAVLQMNFRGSTGYGAEFLQKGYREWGQRIQDDITDGVRWAIAEGIADADRVGIYGISYGGYSSLMGAVRTPALYRSAASYAGVSDIETTLSDWEYYESAVDTVEQMIGGERGDKERLRENSPLRRAPEIRIPVLLGHGVDDPIVHVKQSQRMAKALRDAGKDVTYLEFPNEIHGFALEANRIRWYEALIAFFEKNLAPRAQPAAAAAP